MCSYVIKCLFKVPFKIACVCLVTSEGEDTNWIPALWVCKRKTAVAAGKKTHPQAFPVLFKHSLDRCRNWQWNMKCRLYTAKEINYGWRVILMNTKVNIPVWVSSRLLWKHETGVTFSTYRQDWKQYLHKCQGTETWRFVKRFVKG